MKLSGKVVLCGDGEVGKTALRKRYIGGIFNPNYIRTLGADFAIKSVALNINNTDYIVKLSIWDLAGQPAFSNIRAMYFNGGHAALIVYDITNRKSFENIPNWLKEIRGNIISSKTIPILIIGNKIDLKEGIEDYIKTSEVELLIQRLKKDYETDELEFLFTETSALTGENVNPAFEELVKVLIKIQ
ncbi:MAG: GTP-binding protein [Candidatus Hodarchaeales archaeon]|jgi:small GTP-binding protein